MKHALGNSRPHLAHKFLRDDLNRKICGVHEAKASVFAGLRQTYGILYCHRLARALRHGACAATSHL